MPDIATLMKRRVELENIKRDLKTELGIVNMNIDEIDASILKSMDDSGVSKMTVDGFTVFDDQRLSVKITDPVGLVAAAHALGLDNMLTMNTNSLRAHVRSAYLYDDRLDELVIQKDRLPECLRDVITMEETRTIKLRKA